MQHQHHNKNTFFTGSFEWQPLPLGDLLERKGLFHHGTLLLIGIWVFLLAICLYSVSFYAPKFQNITTSRDFQLISIFATTFPPLLISTLLLFWFGFEWGFIPAYLSTFLIGLTSGMNVGWALLFGLAVVLGLGIYALTYYSFKVNYTLRSLTSLSVFVGVSFIASMASSLGALLWCHIHEIELAQTFTVWKAWWTGTFLQTLVIIAPILLLASPYVERWKSSQFHIPERTNLSLSWIYSAILSIVVVLSIFIWANGVLGSLRIQQELHQYAQISEEAIIGATRAFELTTWIAVSMAVVAGLGGIKLVGSWNKSLKEKVHTRTRQLHERVQQFKATFEQAAVGVAHISIDGQFLKVNEKMVEITGRSATELKRLRHQDLTHPEDRQIEHMNLKLLKQGEMENYLREKRYLTDSDTPTWVNASTSLVHDNHGEPWYFISVIEDISDRKQYEQQLKESLEEKETLLAEIHHRVKNNLAVVSALLELQANTTPDPDMQNLLQHAISRIKSMAMVHRLLYESNEMDSVNLKTYIQKLTKTIRNTFSEKDKEIRLHTDMDTIKLDTQQAIPCGLIINELIINAYKHAFDGRKKGNIYIRLEPDCEDSLLLQVQDDGVGLPENFNPKSRKSLGMKLIHTLSRQLKGSLETENRQGAVFNLRFAPK